MRFIATFVGVAAVAAVQLYAAGPLGLSLDLSRHWTALAVFIGGMIGVITFVLFGDKLVAEIASLFRWLARRPRKEPEDDQQHEGEDPGRFERLVDRLGASFLGVAGPITIGGWAAALLGTANGIDKLRLILWLAVGQAIVTVGYVYSLAELTD